MVEDTVNLGRDNVKVTHLNTPTENQLRREFKKLVEAGHQGHTGDIVARDSNFAAAMAEGLPDGPLPANATNQK